MQNNKLFILILTVFFVFSCEILPNAGESKTRFKNDELIIIEETNIYKSSSNNSRKLKKLVKYDKIYISIPINEFKKNKIKTNDNVVGYINLNYTSQIPKKWKPFDKFENISIKLPEKQKFKFYKHKIVKKKKRKSYQDKLYNENFFILYNHSYRHLNDVLKKHKKDRIMFDKNYKLEKIKYKGITFFYYSGIEEMMGRKYHKVFAKFSKSQTISLSVTVNKKEKNFHLLAKKILFSITIK